MKLLESLQHSYAEYTRVKDIAAHNERKEAFKKCLLGYFNDTFNPTLKQFIIDNNTRNITPRHIQQDGVDGVKYVSNFNYVCDTYRPTSFTFTFKFNMLTSYLECEMYIGVDTKPISMTGMLFKDIDSIDTAITRIITDSDFFLTILK